MKKEGIYYCKNGAYHEYECCEFCWNNHPIVKKSGKDYFDKEVRQKINDYTRKQAIKRAMTAGFSKKQAEYLERNTTACFQNIIL